jgi:hypothetical protein
MRKRVLVLTTTAAILSFGAIAANAQAPGAQTPATQQSPATQPTPGVHYLQSEKRLQYPRQSKAAGSYSARTASFS